MLCKSSLRSEAGTEKKNKQTNKMKTKEKAYVKQCRLKLRTD